MHRMLLGAPSEVLDTLRRDLRTTEQNQDWLKQSRLRRQLVA